MAIGKKGAGARRHNSGKVNPLIFHRTITFPDQGPIAHTNAGRGMQTIVSTRHLITSSMMDALKGRSDDLGWVTLR